MLNFHYNVSQIVIPMGSRVECLFASTLFRQGIKINVVSKLLGHKDVATTYEIYIHMIPEEMDEAVDAVGKVMMGE
jgi:hypothetical protein